MDSCLLSVSLDGDCRNGLIETGQTLRVHIAARLGPRAIGDGVTVAVCFTRADNVKCHSVNSCVNRQCLYPLGGSKYGISLVVPDLPLLSGEYTLLITLCHPNNVHFYDYWKGVAPFKVTQRTKGEVGVLRMKHRWERP